MLRRVVVLAFDGCQSLDVTGPLEVFATAAAHERSSGDEYYAVRLVSLDGRVVQSESGFGLVPKCSMAEAEREGIDTLVVAGGVGARRVAQQADVVARV
ncbi:MAG TPA: DJ-1/PfpI family protein, partial [Polyangiales bacterium]|nr:DJ-1/PfpI family protein [Polyangiales bacterium]